jgi:hypothetical protein
MLLDKVLSNVYARAIELSFQGNAVPSTITGWQPFYNTTFATTNFSKSYAAISSINFFEESVTSAAGVSYKQKISWKFPYNDAHRSERIALIHQIKFVKLKFTNKQDLVIGRNDYNQNTLPTIKTSSDGQLCVVEIETQSIFPSGFTPNIGSFGLPCFIPVTFNP